MCCDVGLVSEFCLTAGCVLMDPASPAASQAAVYANGLMHVGDNHCQTTQCHNTDDHSLDLNNNENLKFHIIHFP
jgi:hypothetical protein